MSKSSECLNEFLLSGGDCGCKSDPQPVCDECHEVADSLQSIVYQQPHFGLGRRYPDPTKPQRKMQVCGGCWWALQIHMWGSD